MKTFEELTDIAKQEEFLDKLTGIESLVVYSLRGIWLACKAKSLDKETGQQAHKAIQLAYDHAQTEQMIHQNACRMWVEMAKVNREMKLHGCPLCKRALEIIDGGNGRMKARIPPGSRIPKKQKQWVDQYAKEQAEQEQKKQSSDYINRLLKLVFVTLHQEFRFGKKRLVTFHDRFYQILMESIEDALYWRHVDQIVIDQLGMEFAREDFGRFEDNHPELPDESGKLKKEKKNAEDRTLSR